MQNNSFVPPISRLNNPPAIPNHSNSIFTASSQVSQFFSNPKSEYEDRRMLLQKSYNAQLKQSYQSQLQDSKKYRKLTITSNIAQSPEASLQVYYSPQIPKKEPDLTVSRSPLPQVPWIEDHAQREQSRIDKKNMWLHSLNDQINQRILDKNKEIAQREIKERQDEARIKRELQELDLAYRKELVLEQGENFFEETYLEGSKAGPEKQREEVVKKAEKRVEEVKVYYKEPKNAPKFRALLKENPDEKSSKNLDKLHEKQKLIELRSEVNEMIKGLKFEAQASKFERDEILREMDMYRSLLHDRRETENYASKGFLRTGKSIIASGRNYD